MHPSSDGTDEVEEGNSCSCKGQRRAIYACGEEPPVELEDVDKDVDCTAGI